MIIWLLSTFFTTTNTKLGDFVKDKVTLITHRYISGYIKIKNSIFLIQNVSWESVIFNSLNQYFCNMHAIWLLV